MNRREFLAGTAAAAGLSYTFPAGFAQDSTKPRRRILFFTKSSGFEHSSIKRKGDELSHAERVFTDLGKTSGFDVECSKDGRLFTAENLAKFDAYLFYTTGDLTQAGTDKQPPMSAEGKAAFLEAIKNGKGYLGTHSASDTFHSPGVDRNALAGEKMDPYVAMLGGEFIRHGPQQKAHMIVLDHKFPGLAKLEKSFEMMEEWYSLKDFAKNLHVLLVQETKGMNGIDYQRPVYPATWARMHGKGRVFYTSMGHREDVWTNPIFQSILLGGVSWATGNVEADVTPNLDLVTPEHSKLPPKPEPKKKA